MRRQIMAGNWKMNKNIAEAVDLASKLKAALAGVEDKEIVVCPTAVCLQSVADTLSDSEIAVGAQNIHWEDTGAYTGEISAPMIKSAGCSYVIIGHSERRQYFGETDETVNKKLASAIKHCLTPIVCVGETLEQREKDLTFKVIENQIKNGLLGIDEKDLQRSVIAYEPVWAIGTGKTATPEQAQEVHAFIRSLLPKSVAQDVRILYGGSVKPDNTSILMAKPDIDGALVGGASLKAEDFTKIVKY
jgi:triosephosphate isomerase